MDQSSAFLAALEADFPLDFFANDMEPTASSSPTPPPFMPQQHFDFTSLLHGDDFLDQPFTYSFPSQSALLPAAPLPAAAHASSQGGHSRSTSRSSVFSDLSVNTALSTPPPAAPPSSRERSCTPAHTPGPLLLPKIRSQDQNVSAAAGTVSQPSSRKRPASSMMSAAVTPPRKTHKRSSSSSSSSLNTCSNRYSNKEASTYRPVKQAPGFASAEESKTMMNSMAYAHMSFSGLATPSPSPDDRVPQANSLLLCSPAGFAREGSASFHTTPPPSVRPHQHQQPQPAARPASSSYGMDSGVAEFAYQGYGPLPFAFTPEPTPAPVTAPRATTTLINYLTTPNPAASLVRTVSIPHRDPSAQHFWWDVRSLTAWSSFDARAVLALPAAAAALTTPIPQACLPAPAALSSRHPDTEAALHAIYADYYLPKLNAALAVSSSSSSSSPLQFSLPKPAQNPGNELLYIANPEPRACSSASSAAAAAQLFGGKQTARIVGLVRGFDAFNTGMRHEGAIQQVRYLRALAALQHHMRTFETRYGFILTEIELVVVRLAGGRTPAFGAMEVTSVSLDASSETADGDDGGRLSACLALWGLAQLAAAADDDDGAAPGREHWRAEIGAPADATRRVAAPREPWIPKPQTVETREAKRNRGWVWPEDPVSKKEVGKRGVKYGGV